MSPVPEPDEETLPRPWDRVIAAKAWKRPRYWVAAIVVIAFATAIPSSPSGALVCIGITLLGCWRWDDIVRWNAARRGRSAETGVTSPGATAPTSDRQVDSRSYVAKTLVPGETVVYRAHLSRLILLRPWRWIQYLTTEMAVTNRRVLVKRGWLSRSTIELRLSLLESAQVHQGVVGRAFRYGDVILVGSGGSRERLNFVADPLALRRGISTAQIAQEDKTLEVKVVS